VKKQKRRSSYLKLPKPIELQVSPVVVWGYNGDGEFVCRLEINSAGIAIIAGTKGRKTLRNLTWERLVKDLTDAK
jgi:hypothetical protein